MKVYGRTDRGQKRESNQDTFYENKFSNKAAYAIVCDGMGGENFGDIASRMTCDSIKEDMNAHFLNMTITQDTVQQVMIDAVAKANLKVFEKAKSDIDYRGMGTTLLLVVILEDSAYITHIGDSRVYAYQEGKLQQLTVDHSLVQHLFQEGSITQEQMATHPRRNMITRAVGMNACVDVDYIEVPFEAGKLLLLCTDGLTNMCSDSKIAELILTLEQEQLTTELIRAANAAGGSDNITVAVIDKRDE